MLSLFGIPLSFINNLMSNKEYFPYSSESKNWTKKDKHKLKNEQQMLYMKLKYIIPV